MKLKNLVKRVFTSLTAIVMMASAVAFLPEKSTVEAAATVGNPVIWADVPDVDVIRVGDTYYMVSTTMYFSPGAPIMKSKDLVSWEICNYVYDTYANGDVQNLTNGKHDYAHGQWATSLRYHKGTYYVFFGSYGSGKSYIYKTNDIENGTWTRSEINGMYHDASLFFDDDGRNYLIYGGGGEIQIKELNAEMTGFKQGGASKTLFKTGLSGLAGEGAHVHKINGYYYVFIIAWPNGQRRIEICYRSKDILGNYEGKTVLDSGLGTYGAGVAQGGIVDTPDGKWYGMLFQDHGAVGRIPVLVPVTWQNDWPMMGVNGAAPLTIQVDGTPAGTYLVRDDAFEYSTNKLDLQWQWNHNPDNSAWSVTARPGFLRLTNKTIASHLLNARNTLTTRTEGPACSSVVKLDTSGMKPGDRAGLAAFQFNFGQVGVLVADDGSKKVYYANNGNYSGNSDVLASRENIVQQENLNGKEVYLKIDFQFATVNNGSSSNNIDKANFFYSYDGVNWTKIGNTLGMTYDLKLFTGYRPALYSYGTKNTGGYADFDFFDYERQAWNEGTDANKPAGPVEPIEPDENGYFYHSTYEENLDSWAGRGAATVAANSTESYAGGKSLFVSGRTSAWNGASRPLNPLAFEPGKEYSFSADVLYNTGDATDTFYMKLQYTDASGETMYDSIAEATVTKGDWTQLTNTNYTIPAGASNMQVYIETAESTIDFYVDEAIGGVAGTKVDGPTPISFIPGDITCDGVIDGFDVAAAKKGMANVLPTVAAERAADVNKSGALDADDVAQIQSYVLGKIDKFSAKLEQSTPGNNDNNNTGAVTIKGDWDNYTETATPAMQTFYANAIHNMGNTARLRAKVAKAQSGEKTTIAYIGGSITEGVGASDTCYAKRSYDYFAKTFGTGNNVSYINAGMSGTSSAVGLMRAQRDILNAKPDVIFIEFSVNDHPGDTYTKSFEGLVKKCLMQENEPAVIIIINRSKGGYSMQDQMSKVGKNYNVPIISMDDALTKAFASGTLKDSDYFSDEYHPHANGSALIADSIAYYYRQALKTANKSDSYTIPTTTAYGDEYATGSIVPVSELANLNAGSFKAERSNTRFEYGYTYQKNSGNTPLKFTTQGKGIFLVFKSNQNSSLGNLVVTVNGKSSKISGNRQYAWGGADAEIAYIQNTSGTLEVSMNMENAGSDFNIWGIGVIK